eukprot:scaffold973_cov399-Prasinococcus_capsulatus_cf.AAC.33
MGQQWRRNHDVARTSAHWCSIGHVTTVRACTRPVTAPQCRARPSAYRRTRRHTCMCKYTTYMHWP